MATERPNLSVIIPTLNEASHLPRLLQDLNQQKNIQFEVIIVDGGSNDQTLSHCEDFKKTARHPVSVLESRPGRAIQLNKGAKTSATDDFLFLHADSRLRDSSLLANAQQYIYQYRHQQNNPNICGHFPLRFFSSPGQTSSYYFYESKTYLNKPDCINGDQGFWISRDYFNKLGQFDETLPYMEDARLAAKICKDNNWITLPGEIETSARRFEVEGFTNRQILNSFLCNFNAMNETQYFDLTREIYQQQDKTSKLRLRPFLKLTHRFMYSNGLKSALQRWYQTGSYIANNAWQLAFAIDCKRNKKLGMEPNASEVRALEFYENNLARAADWPVIRALIAMLTFVWFYSLFISR